MRPLRHIGKSVRKAVIDTQSDADQAVLADLVRRLGQTQTNKSADRRLARTIPVLHGPVGRLIAAAAILTVAILLLTYQGRLSSPAYALSQTVAAFRNIRFLHVVQRDEAGAIREERWIEVGSDGRQARHRHSKPPYTLVIDDGQTIARFHNDARTVTLYHSRDMQYEWIRPLGPAFDDLLRNGLILEENVTADGRPVHKVWWPAMRSVCWVDPETRLPVAIEGCELSYEEPPDGTFEIAIPQGYQVADDTPPSDFYATVEVIQPDPPLVEIVNRDEVIKLHRTGPDSYAGELDIRVACDVDVSWALSIRTTGFVAGDYSCAIDRWNMAPPGGVATAYATITGVQGENLSKDAPAAAVTLRVEARPKPMNDARALRDLGLALYDAKRYEEALAAFERMEKQDNADEEARALALTWQGHVLDLLGRRSEAVARYETLAGMGLTGGVHQDDYGLRYEFTPYAKERMTTLFTRVERLDSR